MEMNEKEVIKKDNPLQIGPKKVIIEELHCLGCTFFFDRSIQSGNNEVHHYFCQNDAISQFASGKSIGIDTKTPDWCPERRGGQ